MGLTCFKKPAVVSDPPSPPKRVEKVDVGNAKAAETVEAPAAHDQAAPPVVGSAPKAIASNGHAVNPATDAAATNGLTKCPFLDGVQPSSKVPISKCPLGHGTVGNSPFPGYTHGKHPEICWHGCVPNPKVRREETVDEYLRREAVEYQNLFHFEHGSSEEVKRKRVNEIMAEIDATGTYTHTREELEYGARLSWRNAPKCANRKFWDQLRLIDSRHVKTNADMFRSLCLQMVEANAAMGTAAMMNIFRAKHPHESDGPRVWNSQLFRFAAWRQRDMSVLGDPAELKFTELIQNKFGWEPEQRSMFTILPMVLQVNPNEPPELFEWDPNLVLTVPLRHPKYPWFGKLGLMWYGIPVVANMELELGGLRYTAIPFNGWYADTEVLRNMTDEGRFNMLPVVAQHLGLNMSTHATLWRDAALCVVNEAIVNSYQQANVSMVDHHTLMRQFWEWYNKEKKVRGYSPGNWKWIIPPVAAHTSRCYLELNKMIEYTLNPALMYAPGPAKYNAKFKHMDTFRMGEAPINVLSNLPLMMGLGKMLRRLKADKVKIVLLYSTVTNTAKNYALRTQNTLKSHFDIRVVSTEDFTDEVIQRDMIIVYMLCTYGSGAPPASARKFLSYLTSTHASRLQGMLFCVFGVGSSAYPRFCGAADLASSLLFQAGLTELIPTGKVDVMAKTEPVYQIWLKQFVTALAKRGIAPKACRAMLTKLALSSQDSGAAKQAFVPWYNLGDITGSFLELAVDPKRLQAKCVDVKEMLPCEDPIRSTMLCSLDFSVSGHSQYYPGDHISIYFTNNLQDPEMEAFLAGFGFGSTRSLQSVFVLTSVDTSTKGKVEPPFPTPNTYENVFRMFVNVREPPSETAVQVLAGFATDAKDILALSKAAKNYDAWLVEVEPRWIDTFELFPSLANKLPLNIFFQLVPLIVPRAYSIASAPGWVDPHTVDKLGPAVLVFGCRTRAKDMMCYEELMHLKRQGVLKDVIIAYSREPGTAKEYVQDAITNRTEALRTMMVHPKAHVYICGDTMMSAAVSGSLAKLMGRAAFDAMVERGGFHEDVFGITSAGASKMQAQQGAASAKALIAELGSLAQDGDVAGMEAILNNPERLGAKFDLNGSDTSGNTLLHVAVQAGQLDVVRMLIGRKIGLNSLDQWGLTPLAAARRESKDEIASALESAGGLMVSSFHRNFYPLHTKVILNDLDGLRADLAAGANVNQPDMLGGSALHLACALGRDEATKILLAAGTAVNMVNRVGNSAIQAALAFSRLECVELCKAAGGTLVAGIGGDFTSGRPSTFDWDPANDEVAKDLGITPEQITIVQGSWSWLSQGTFPEKTRTALEEYGAKLFHCLFEISPALLELFPFRDPVTGVPVEAEMRSHGLRVTTALGDVLNDLNDLSVLIPKTEALIKRHVKYGVKVEHYDILSMCLAMTLERVLETSWSDDERVAWNAVLGMLTRTAQRVYGEAAEESSGAGAGAASVP
eukprot:jgi/Mesvir1/27819/Mv07497-RA.2